MKKYMKISLNKRLNAISLAAFIPMFLVMLYLLVSLSGATKAYADITQSVTYANQYAMDFKERMDNSMYLAVIGKKSMEELGMERRLSMGSSPSIPTNILMSCLLPVMNCRIWRQWTSTGIRSRV